MIIRSSELEMAEVGEIFACARCLVSTDQPDEVRIGGWTPAGSSQDELAQPLLMVQGDYLLCRECWELQAPAWLLEALEDAVQPTTLAYISPAIGEEDVVACPGCAEAFTSPDLVFSSRRAWEGELCTMCDSIGCVTAYAWEFGGWISLEGENASDPEFWEIHRNYLTRGFVRLLTDCDLLGEE